MQYCGLLRRVLAELEREPSIPIDSMGLLFSKGPEGGESSHSMQLEGTQGETRGLALSDYRITACAPCQLLTADLGGSKASGDRVGSVGVCWLTSAIHILILCPFY